MALPRTEQPAELRPVDDRKPGNEPGPAPGPRPKDPVVTTVGGEIGKLWRKLGGDGWAFPATNEYSIDGRGRGVEFTVRRDLSLVQIVWTRQTGAHLVTDRMNRGWVSHRRRLGFPTSEELPTRPAGGSFQVFENGVVVYHPSFGAHEVHGAINARYLAVNGSNYGFPTTDESDAANGGKFNHFHSVETGQDRSIYWSPATGAWEVYGAIRAKWAAMGFERSALGYPTYHERETHDKVGRFQEFQGGLIVWHPTLGAFAVLGDTNRRYLDARGSVFGYPVADAGKTAGGAGTYQRFRQLETGLERAIYCRPGVGALVVADEILQRWGEARWESGFLGYPTNEAQPWGSIPNRLVQDFEHGQIFRDADGAFADPMVWEEARTPGGVTVSVKVVASSNGDVTMSGYYRSNSLVGFDYVVQILLASPTRGAVSFSRTGHVSSTHGSDEKDNFSQSLNNPHVRLHYREFERATLRLQEHHDNSFTATLGDLAMGALKWTAGELLLTPGNALILVATTEIVSAATSGSLIPGAAVLDGTLWLAGPSGTMIALVADATVHLATKFRDLRVEDYDRANLAFGGTLPPREQIRISDGLGGGGRFYTFRRFDDLIILNMGPYRDNPWQARTADFTVDGQGLVHELTHAWQYHHDPNGVAYVAEALWGKVKERPHPGLTPDHEWDFYDQEQKAQIVDGWFARYFNDGDTRTGRGLASAAALADIRFRKHIEPRVHAARP